MRKNVSVVIPAHNEEKNIKQMVRRLLSWPRIREVIVVANGCTDATVPRARVAGAKVIVYDEPLGHDVGRAIGIARAKGDIILVLDADMPFYIHELEPFVKAVDNGVDIALNQYPLRKSPRYHHPTALAKESLNIFLGRKDLNAASLTTVPHALSRKSVTRLGPRAFSVPPVAQTKATLAGLRIEAVSHVPVGLRNPVKKHARKVRDLIIGDCLEAVAYLIHERGVRGGFTDYKRNRGILEQPFEVTGNRGNRSHSILAVVPTADASENVTPLLARVQGAGFSGTCLVANGRTFGEGVIPNDYPVLLDTFTEQIGHDVGRAVACLRHPADMYVFTDADITLKEGELEAYRDALCLGADIAVNDLDQLLPLNSQRDAVSITKRFLNLVLGHPELGVASLTAVPHAMTQTALRHIGANNLSVPPLAHAIALSRGLSVVKTCPVDVIRRNRIRITSHSRQSGRPVENMIVGDHIEAIAYLQQESTARLIFPDVLRHREVVKKPWFVSNLQMKMRL